MGCKSMCNSCCLCFIKSTQVFTICVKANLAVLHQVGLFHNLKICDDFSCCTLLLCDNCIRRLNIFNKLFLGCWNNNQRFYQQIMQDHPTPVENSSPTPTEHTPSNNCNCENCKDKFSGLPLLAQVIENIQQEKTPITLKQKILKGFKDTSNVPSHIHKSTSSTIIFTSPTTTGSTSSTTTTSSVSTVTLPSPTTISSTISSSSITSTTSILPLPSTSTLSPPTNIQSSLLTSTISSPSTSSKPLKVMKCEHCDKSFTHRGDLNKHLRSHTGEQPYVCPVCNRRFTHTSNLSRHLRVHSGDRPFHCDRCNRDFSRKDKLIMHQKTKLCMKSSQK